MKYFFALGLLAFQSLYAQRNGYWQQEVHYNMEVVLDDALHQVAGMQNITYVNHSPDTLRLIFMHLYFNSFKPGSMMDELTQLQPDPDGRIAKRLSKLSNTETGWQRVETVLVNGLEPAVFVYGSVMRLELQQPILPGQSTEITTRFKSQIPQQIRRSGRNNSEGVAYTMTQWYPKIAAYSERGWHTQQYVNREFFGPFGSFDVKIDLPGKYVMAGTGQLLNACNLNPAKVQAFCDQAKGAPTDRQIWHWKAENVHDFAWAADPDFLVTKKTADIGHPIYFVRKSDTDSKAWQLLESHGVKFFNLMSSRYGQYPYPQFSVIQGGDGGMEYPMCTMILGRNTADEIEGMTGLLVHEAAHNWYYGILGFDEQRWAWMDEGFTTFAENEIMNILFNHQENNAQQSAYRAHRALVSNNWQEPLTTPADHFARNRAYGISSYSMGAIYLQTLRYLVGDEVFYPSLKSFFNQWKFKHPEPDDLLRILEQKSGMQLHWFHDLWIGTTQTVDYAITDMRGAGRGFTRISFEKLGYFPMPLEVEIGLDNGETRTLYIPSDLTLKSKPGFNFYAEVWPWTRKSHTVEIELASKDIKYIHIDPLGSVPDVNLANNRKPELPEKK